MHKFTIGQKVIVTRNIFFNANQKKIGVIRKKMNGKMYSVSWTDHELVCAENELASVNDENIKKFIDTPKITDRKKPTFERKAVII